jgi:DNA polymerase I
MSNKKLFLLDGFALIFRAHFAYIKRPLINSKGINTSAIQGFTRVLWSIIQKEKPTHIAVALDPPGGTFRNEIYPEYKAQRETAPDDIKVAIPLIIDVIKAMNIPILMKENYEADDVVGTIAKQAEKEGFQVFMMTSDKDYAQLVSENIFLYKPGRQGNDIEILGIPEVLKSWEIDRVEQVIDVLGLQGDAVDNIPGIPGIGGKTAKTLLAQYGSVENLIANAHQLKGKQKDKVIEFAEQGLLSKKLATIDINVPIVFNADDCQLSEVNREKLGKLFKELEFRSLATTILGIEEEPQENTQEEAQKDLFGNSIANTAPKKTYTPPIEDIPAIADKNIGNTDHDYKLVNTPEERTALIAILEKETVICYDTETTGLDPNEAEIVGLAFSVKNGTGYYVPMPREQEAATAIVQEFKGILENPNTLKIGQNLKYDNLLMKWYGVEVSGRFFDTMVAHYLCEPDRRHKLDYLAETYLNYQMVAIETLIGKRGKNQLSMRDISVDKVSQYAAEDADITLRLYPVMAKMMQDIDVSNLFETLEMPLVKVLTDIEYNGVRLNSAFLNEYSKELDIILKEKEQDIYVTAGTHFNIASPKQVGEILFDRLGLPYKGAKTKTGQYSTNEDKLEELAADYEIVNKILEFRKFQKLKSTYVDALPLMVNPKTGRIHTSYNQARAATGRLSSENPNLQNIPIKDEAGRKIREAFIPRDENHVLLAADYSQIELRLIAQISGDQAMLDAFQKGYDIHTATAARVYGVPLEEVTPSQRRNAKTVNFSIIYGAGATNLSQQLKIKRTEAKKLIDNYFDQYHGLKKYFDETVQFARDNGYVITLMGRKRYLRDINSKSSLERSNAERIAINTPVQGSAADMIKVAMINIHKAFKERNFQSKMILQVHDELVFDVLKTELEEVKMVVEDLMKNAMAGLSVPILVGMGTGNNWLEAH